MKVEDVFVAGGLPVVTYNPRPDLDLERRVGEYLQQRHKILSVSGPTKSGKSVLLKKMIAPELRIWISGGQISEVGVFWDLIIARTAAFTSTTVSSTEASEETTGRNLKASAGAFGTGGEVQSVVQKKDSKGGSVSSSRVVVNAVTALESLTRQRLPLVIDDFHYIAPDIQKEIIRSLKDPISEGLPVILISVPHRAFDTIKLEKEMTGRLKPLLISPWNEEELRFIAEKGFHTLNVVCPIEVALKLTSEAFGSPHLMQEFCFGLCRQNGVTETLQQSLTLKPPKDWQVFFRSFANETSKLAFDRLVQGPRQRTDRTARRLKNGKSCDIYEATLLAVASTGPKAALTYEDIRTGLRKVLVEKYPQANQVLLTLKIMSKIARKEIEGEPVVDWDGQHLHISDPFFAYYLRWGVEIP